MTVRSLFVRLIAGPAALLLMAQTSPAPAPSPPQDRDVVVEGVREAGPKAIEGARSAVPSAVGFRKVAERSEFFVRCVRRPDMAVVRAIIDGQVNATETRYALDRFVRSNTGCYPDYPVASQSPPFFGDCNPMMTEDVSFAPSTRSQGVSERMQPQYLSTCRAFYDRGMLLLRAIDRFAPDVKLTSRQTADPAVQARFDAVEVPRNRLRLYEDYRYFSVAVCLVRMEPVLATRLVHAEGDRRSQDVIGRLMLLRARSCVGDTPKVRVEPNQFRIYIADAFYRWAVAARGVATLLPADASRPG